MVLYLHKKVDGYTQAQIPESRKRSSRLVRTQTFECYFHSQTLLRRAFANPAFPGRVAPSPPLNVSCIRHDCFCAAPALLPASFHWERIRRWDRARWFDRSTNQEPPRASPIPESSLRNFRLALRKLLHLCAPRFSG